MSKASILTEEVSGGYTEPAVACDALAFKTVVESRRAVRVFSSEPVPEADLREILRLGSLAPSSSNLQMWEFHWVRDPRKKQLLAEACLSQTAARTAPEMVVCVARLATWPQVAGRILEEFSQVEKATNSPVPEAAKDYYRRLIPFILRQGPFGLGGLLKRMLFTLRGLKTPTPRSPVSSADMRVWAHKSCALACENIMLAARAMGYDSCPLEGFDAARVGSLLNLPRDAETVMIIPIGKRAVNGVYGPRMRLSMGDIVKVH